MAFQALPNGALAILEYGIDTVTWTNTLWFTKPDYTLTDQQELAFLLHNRFGTNLMPNLNNTWFLRYCKVYDMRSDGAPIVFDDLPPVQGGIVGAAAPINVALVTTFRSAIRGRSGRGRNYVTGFDESDTSSQSVNDSTVVSNILSCYAGIQTAVQTNGWSWVVASRETAGVQRPTIIGFEITEVAVRSSFFGTQRRRVKRV